MTDSTASSAVHAEAAPHPDGHAHADIDHHVRAAFIVFGALMLLTGATVGAAYLHLPTGPAIALALFIAAIKGSLVLGWFMHLISERKLIYAVLLLTLVFFLVLLLIPYWTAADVPRIQPAG